MSSQPKRFLLLMALALLVLAPFCAQPASAQSATVTFTNTTRGGGWDLWVYDNWRIDVHGPTYQDVMVCGTHNGQSTGCTVYGQTDGGGDFTMSGSVDDTCLGDWTEVWYVGSTQATPSLAFTVWSVPCESMSASAMPWLIVDYDDYYSQQQYPDRTIGMGYSYVEAVLDSSNGCRYVSTEFSTYPFWPYGQIDATLLWLWDDWVTWLAEDNLNYNTNNRCLTCSYPIWQDGTFDFWALDVDDAVYWVYTTVTLLVWDW